MKPSMRMREENNKMELNKSLQDSIKFKWTDEEYLAATENISIQTARNIIDLFEKGNTIPFLARYRSNLVENLKPDKLRKAKTTYEYIQLMHVHAAKLVHQVLATEKSISSDLLSSIQSAQTLEELEYLGTPFKSGSARTLAQRAKKLGLEAPAKVVLEGTQEVKLESLVNTKESGLENVQKVKEGIQHIIADIVSKNAAVLSELDKIYSSKDVLLQSKFKGDQEELKKSKYYLYRDFSQPVPAIKPHQTLAINRGEAANELIVKVVIPVFLWNNLKSFCEKKWLESGRNDQLRKRIFRDSVDDAIKRLIGPLAVRRIRAKLKAEAANEAINCFAINLRQLLMTPPVNGHVVMGIDPGFGHGCKVAVVSPTGVLLTHDIFFLKEKTEALKKLKHLVLNYGCEMIALGNGTACRETENLLSKLIRRREFKHLNVQYTIIDEQGVSIYSCSSAAADEFQDMDPKIVGAISIARRLQNPLSELVKVEPKHLGVGMYQHDVKEKDLVSTLDEIVSECVSFVGVDINSASFYLLRRVAGLSSSKAEEIIKYRNQNCPFKSREDLMKVKGIKTKTFLQCGGFIRVIPSTARCSQHSSCNGNFNPLDETWIHPESYPEVYKLLDFLELELKNLGTEEFVQEMVRKTARATTEDLASLVGCSVLSMELILDTLKRPKDFDLRSLSPGPIFHKEFKSLNELFPGQILQGMVRNVVNFGAFVDVGVGSNGLIHISKGGDQLKLNDRVEVEVMSTNLDPPKLELRLISVINYNNFENKK